MTTYVGTVIGKSENGTGYMVQVFLGGQRVTYGPMHFVVTPPFPDEIDIDPYSPGDLVVIQNFQIQDQFIILGKYVDMVPPIPPNHEGEPVPPEGGDALVVEGIEENYQEPS